MPLSHTWERWRGKRPISRAFYFIDHNRIRGIELALACNRGYVGFLFKGKWKLSPFNDITLEATVGGKSGLDTFRK